MLRKQPFPYKSHHYSAMLGDSKSGWLQSIRKFLGLQEDLPIYGGAPKGGNGVKGVPTVDKWVALTVFWTFAFVLLMGYGVYHCRDNAYKYNVACFQSDCFYKIEDRRLGTSSVIQFQKTDLIDAELIRIDTNGEYVDHAKVRADPKKFFGYSIKLKVRLPPEPNSRMKIERGIVFSPYDLSRRVARTQAKKISDAIVKENMDFDVSKTANFTTAGILCVVIGFLGLLLICLFGQWSEHNPRKLKKMS